MEWVYKREFEELPKPRKGPKDYIEIASIVTQALVELAFYDVSDRVYYWKHPKLISGDGINRLLEKD